MYSQVSTRRSRTISVASRKLASDTSSQQLQASISINFIRKHREQKLNIATNTAGRQRSTGFYMALTN